MERVLNVEMLHELPLTVCGAAARRRLGALVTRRPNNGHCRILAAQQHTNDEQQHTRKVATVAREVFDGNFGARLVKSKFAPPVRTSESPRVALVQMQCVHLSGVPFLRYVGLLEQKLREFLGIGGRDGHFACVKEFYFRIRTTTVYYLYCAGRLYL